MHEEPIQLAYENSHVHDTLAGPNLCDTSHLTVLELGFPSCTTVAMVATMAAPTVVYFMMRWSGGRVWMGCSVVCGEW